MNQDEEQVHLLGEIRDLLAEQLEEYRRVTDQSLEFQRRAIARQEEFSRLYRRVLIVAAVLVVGAILLLSRLPRR